MAREKVGLNTAYNITFEVEGREQTWLRYAPNIWKATVDGRAAIVKEYGEGAKLVKVAPYVAPPTPEGNPFNVGNILAYEWGYDQTNVDFYQVTKITAKTVIVRRIKSEQKETGFMCGKSTPVGGAFIGKEERKKVQWWHGEPVLSFPHGLAELWNGKPQNYSSYA